ncbi:MAG: 3-dehydroquinate synthase [Gammaproteobacteria bacterium]
MDELTVNLGQRSYPIYIGQGLLAGSNPLRRQLGGSSVMVITNTTIAPLYLERLHANLDVPRLDEVVLPDGEQYKTLDTVNEIVTRLLEQRFDRNVTLVALGGGVVGDIAGFAAACYQRGVDFVQLPTTLLAQVDSSVGGKTGVNHPLGKNMIGAFHQPRSVIIDTDTLTTLDDRQLSAGLAEVIKYGLIRDAEFFGWLEAHIDDLLGHDASALGFAIRRSCENKAAVVAEDERETSGARALLNLGHTFGHAIETGMGYGEWLHGEAVACGMVMAADLSHRLGWLHATAVGRITRLIERARLPVRAPADLPPERFTELMSLDKKVVDGQLRLVLLRDIGQAVVSGDFNPSVLQATLAAA